MSDDEYSSPRLFHPSMALQRYIYVRNCINEFHKSTNINSVVDLGSNDCSFVRFLKQLPFLSTINCLDIDKLNMDRSHNNAKPTPMDLIAERSHSLVINLFLGSALDKDTRFSQVDVVTGIEIIEHLQADMLDSFAENIFGFIQPKVAIITTPNYEYNWLIQRAVADKKEMDESKPPSFRDSDHKFEWTRAEFLAWCESVISKYNHYTFKIDGVGLLDSDEKKETGFCTQIAVFEKKLFAAEQNGLADEKEPYQLYRSYTYKRNDYLALKSKC